MINPPKQVGLLTTEAVGIQGIEDALKGGIACIVFPGLVGTLGTQRLNLVGLQPKDEDILLAHFLHNLNIGTIQRPNRQRTVQGKLHVACP